MGIEMAVGRTKAPSAASGQRILLAVEGDDTWRDLGGNGTWSFCLRLVEDGLTSVKSLLPTGDGSWVVSHYAGDSVFADLVHQKHSDLQPMKQPACKR